VPVGLSAWAWTDLPELGYLIKDIGLSGPIEIQSEYPLALRQAFGPLGLP
jgi:hypothetical protein